MRKLGWAVFSASCAFVFLLGACFDDDDSSSPSDAGTDGGSSSDAANKKDTSTSSTDGGSEASTGPGTVSGIVKDFGPVSGATVIIGSVSKTTGADGLFSFPGIPGTYTMTVIVPQQGGGAENVVSFIGLTTRAPVIINPFDSPSTDPYHSDSTQIDVAASGFGIPLAGSNTFLGEILTTNIVGGGGSGTAASLFPSLVTWPTTTDMLTVDLYAFVTDTNHTVVSFGSDLAVSLVPDGGIVSPPTINLGAVGATTLISGTYMAPAGFTVEDGLPACFLSAGKNEGGINIGVTSAGSYSCSVPTALNFAASVRVNASGTGGGCGRTVSVPSASGVVDVTLDAPAVLTAPTNGSSNVDPTAPFTWTTPTAASPPLYQLIVGFDDNEYIVFGAGIASTALPDLSAYGVTFASEDDGQAIINEFQGVSVDNLVDGTTAVEDAETGASTYVSFTTK